MRARSAFKHRLFSTLCSHGTVSEAAIQNLNLQPKAVITESRFLAKESALSDFGNTSTIEVLAQKMRGLHALTFYKKVY